MKIAMWKTVGEYPTECIFSHIPERGFTRISEFVEVEFPPRNADDVKAERVAAIDAAAADLRKQLDNLAQERGAET